MGLPKIMQMEIIWCDPDGGIALHSFVSRVFIGELQGTKNLQALTLS